MGQIVWLNELFVLKGRIIIPLLRDIKVPNCFMTLAIDFQKVGLPKTGPKVFLS